MARQLTKAGIDPVDCRFEMMAFGPVFPEQGNMTDHKVYMDRTASLERALASLLRDLGCVVVGTHPKHVDWDSELQAVYSGIVTELHAYLTAAKAVQEFPC